MIELEKTYLIKKIPTTLAGCDYFEMVDIYIPISEEHPVLRIRKKGDRYEITKKQTIAGDYSKQTEETIPLTEAEYLSFDSVHGKKISKRRYLYPFGNRVAEIDVFKDDLAGLVVVDFEFTTEEEMKNFEMPDFCLADVTQEVFIAGGKLCGKSYKDIENELLRFGYRPLFIN